MIILICICNVKCKLVLTTTERFTILEDFFRYDFSIIWFSIFISNFIVVEARIQRRICSELNFQQQTRSSFFFMFFPSFDSASQPTHSKECGQVPRLLLRCGYAVSNSN